MARSSKKIEVTLTLSAADLAAVHKLAGPHGKISDLTKMAIQKAISGMAEVTETHRNQYAESAYPSLGKLANQQLGVVGEGIVRYWITEAGYKVADAKNTSYDLHTRKFGRVEVKTSRIGFNGRYDASGIHVDLFDTLTFVGLGLAEPRVWVVPAAEIARMYANKRRCRTAAGRRRYNGLGWSRTEGYTLNFSAANPPSWLDQYEVTDKSMQTAYSKVVGK